MCYIIRVPCRCTFTVHVNYIIHYVIEVEWIYHCIHSWHGFYACTFMCKVVHVHVLSVTLYMILRYAQLKWKGCTIVYIPAIGFYTCMCTCIVHVCMISEHAIKRRNGESERDTQKHQGIYVHVYLDNMWQEGVIYQDTGSVFP